MGIFASNNRNTFVKGKKKSVSLPRKVIYIDYLGIDWNNPGQTVLNAVNCGFNVINFAFYLSSGPADFCVAWEQLGSEAQQSIVQKAHDGGASLLVSAGGATDTPYSNDPNQYATNLCNWAIQNNLDGIDADFENIEPGFKASGTDNLYQWMKSFNQTCRSILGPNRLLTHTPQLPYAATPGKPDAWTSSPETGSLGGYYQVYLDSPTIDFFNFQVYNQGNDNYFNYQTTFIESVSSPFPYSAFLQINNNGKGIPWNKMVFGTYLNGQGSSGNNNPQDIQQYFQLACQQFDYNAGLMLWLWTGDCTAIKSVVDTIFNSSNSCPVPPPLRKRLFLK